MLNYKDLETLARRPDLQQRIATALSVKALAVRASEAPPPPGDGEKASAEYTLWSKRDGLARSVLGGSINLYPWTLAIVVQTDVKDKATDEQGSGVADSDIEAAIEKIFDRFL